MKIVTGVHNIGVAFTHTHTRLWTLWRSGVSIIQVQARRHCI